MEIYFFDVNMRYIGHRKLEDGEEIPKDSTFEISNIKDGEEAYFVDGKWVVNKIVEPPLPPQE